MGGLPESGGIMSWYHTSYEWILDQRDNNPELSREELKKHCSKNYPFAMRKGYAYKAWLKAMGDFFGRESKGKDLFK